MLADGANLFVECIDGGDRSSFLQKPATLDHRIVPQEIDALGKPECSLKDASKKSVEKEVSWTLTGPRTTRWCISYLVMEGLGFEGHHERFRNLCKVDAASWGIQEHLQLSMIAKHMIQVDQYNGYNSLSCEVVFRRLQTIEFAYAEKARESEAKAVGGRLSLEEQQTFGGVTRQAGTLMVCPELLDHVRAEVERDATLAKHLRKAREEREPARQARKKGNKAEGDAPLNRSRVMGMRHPWPDCTSLTVLEWVGSVVIFFLCLHCCRPAVTTIQFQGSAIVADWLQNMLKRRLTTPSIP